LINFTPHIAEPLILRWTAIPNNKYGRIAPFLPAATLIALITYHLTNLTTVEILRAGQSFCAQFTSLASHLPTISACQRGEVPTSFPITNDFFTVVTLTVLAATTFTARHQWSGYSILAKHMTESGAIRFKSSRDRRRFATEIHQANALFRRVSRLSPAILCVVAMLIVLLVVEQHRNGVFAALTPSDRTELEWSRLAYSNWWVAPKNSVISTVTYVLIGTIALHIITIQNIIGPRILLALWRARTTFSIGADYVITDGIPSDESSAQRTCRSQYTASHSLPLG
jgi:hypothetical protein